MENIKIIIINHGHLGMALMESVEMIVGDISDIYTFSLEKNVSLETLIAKVEKCVKSAKGNCIILTDLFGGTPNHSAMYLKQKYNCPVLSGVNLPMVLELVMNRKQIQKVDVLVRKAKEAAQLGIVQE